jgi:8-oxo-dGTP pyrophosphatase MutT (NUDIX family)
MWRWVGKSLRGRRPGWPQAATSHWRGGAGLLGGTNTHVTCQHHRSDDCQTQPASSPNQKMTSSSLPLPELPKSSSPYILDKKVIACGKYQGLGTLSYIDPRDETRTPRERDFIFLRDRDPQTPVGMLVPNIYRDALGRWCTVLVRQFRPQYEADTVEFPAGMVSRHRQAEGPETAEHAAVRELEEETTKTGTAVSTSPPLTSEPVPIAARISAVFVHARDKQGNEAGTQRLDKGEFTTEMQVPLADLDRELRALQAEDVLIDPRVWMFAVGIRCATDLSL